MHSYIITFYKSNRSVFTINDRIIMNNNRIKYNRFQQTNPRVVNKKEIIALSFSYDKVEIEIVSQQPLSPGREGNALRTYSLFLVDAGFNIYLIKTTPGKLFTSRAA